jgi:hypothetical protein
MPKPIAKKTLLDFSVPSTTNVATGPNIDVGDVKLELKSSLINIVQVSPFCAKPNEDANAHLQNFLKPCETVVIWESQLMQSGSVCFPSPS